MKKIVNSLLAVALALGLWSCVNEQPVDAGAAGDASLQFTMKSATAPFVTRADIATANEWNIATLDVYAVEKGGTPVKKLVSGTDYTMVENKSSHTFTITMKPAWMSTNQGKTMSFYFVGNDGTSLWAIENNGVWGHPATIEAIPAGATDAEFAESVTHDLFEYDARNDIFDFRPNGSDKNLMFTATAEIEINGTVKHTGHLKRRQARFDIEVEAELASNFVLKQVMVEGVPGHVPFFVTPDATLLTGYTNHYNYAFVSGTHLAYNAKNPATATSNNVVQGAFYMFPTLMGDYDSDDYYTEITIIGEFNGVETLYPVNVEVGTMVKPNYRYTLKLNPSTGEFEMIGDDWDEGETWEAEEGVNTAKANLNVSAFGSASTTGGVCTVTSTAAGNGLEIEATSEFGTSYMIEYFAGGDAADNTLTVNKTKDFEFTTRATNGWVAEKYTFTTPAGTSAIYAKITLISFEGEGGSDVFWVKRFADGQVLFYNAKIDKLFVGNYGSIHPAYGDLVGDGNLVSFKFGSVIGFWPFDVWEDDGGAWNSEGHSIAFNPTKLKYGTDITSYASAHNPDYYSGATSNALPNIPGYVSADYPKVVSSAEYATVANLRAGKGDPCMLVGYGPDELKAMSDSELQSVLDNAAYRLPTQDENKLFAGTETDQSTSAFWTAGNSADYITYPGIGKFPLVNNALGIAFTYTLPAVGHRIFITGQVSSQGMFGIYWSATPASDSYCYPLSFANNFVDVTSFYYYSDGFSVRCVPNV